ncbi:MAG: thiolase family protein [Pseudomonadota bacterium]
MQIPMVICGYKRSPFTFAMKGALAKTRPDDMAATVIKALIDETGANADDIEDILMGCAFPEAEQGFNLAKIVAQRAELPKTIAGATVNRFCGSSMTTIQMAAGYAQMGAGELFVCAGVESMSRIPMGGFNPMPNPAMMEICPEAYMSMGITAENLAKKYTIDRDAQENFAVGSQSKAEAAQKADHFKDEIVEIDGVTEDGCIRPGTTKEALEGLKLAFDKDGSVTAGTASPLTDGAAAVLIATEEYAKKNKLPIMARIKSVGVAGCDPAIMGIGPVPASQKALERAGVKLDEIDLIELNEAFAAQSLSVLKELGADESKVNIDGGAIALGHPLGASGARITGKLASLMQREKKKLGLATMCIGGGQGTAIILESV